jgi:tRNA threonylcarbamoyladenosine biosynthesis protein TsaB
MKLLLIDTCGSEGSVAIADVGGDSPSIVSATLPGRSASEKLIGAVRELTRQTGIALSDLDAISVVSGPGSFTGVRVGLSAAKGLCEALNVPLIAISRLAVLASAAAAKPGTHVFAALDAGRGEFYLGEYLEGVKLREELVESDALRARIGRSDDRALVVCEEPVATALRSFAPQFVPEPDAASSLSLALTRVRTRHFDDIASADANYLRRTDLEIFAKVKAHAGLREKAAGEQ